MREELAGVQEELAPVQEPDIGQTASGREWEMSPAQVAVALLALAYALLNLFAGFLLAWSGVGLASKALYDRALMLLGGLLIVALALALTYQMVRLMGWRGPGGEPR